MPLFRTTPGTPRLRRTTALMVALGLTFTGLSVVTVTQAAAVAPAASLRTALAAGQRVNPGGRLISPDRFVTLNMQSDGNLTVRAGGHLLWAARTTGRGNYLQMDRVGNVGVFNSKNRLLWSTRTKGSTNHLVLQNTGDLIVRRPTGAVAWRLGTRAVELDAGSVLRAGQFLTGRGGQTLTMQPGGALVLRHGATTLWSSDTQNHPGAFLAVQTDGNAVIYTGGSHKVLWNSGRAGARSRLILSPDGNLALHSAKGKLVWQTFTGRNTSAAGLATQLLTMWGGKVTGLPGVRSDLLATSRNQNITNSSSCGRAVRVDVRLERFLVQLTASYRIKINNIVTGHSCDSGGHPKGRAVDLATVTNLTTRAATSFGGRSGPNNLSMDRTFVTYISTLLPNGAGLGQRTCAGQSGAHPRAGVQFFADACNHQHVQVQPSR